MSAVVTVYTAGPSCMACRQTERHLGRRGITYTRIPIDSDPAILDAAYELDLSAAPIVCASVNGEERYWDGYRPDRIDALR
jgi:glutaredoxin-like protein NrdH